MDWLCYSKAFVFDSEGSQDLAAAMNAFLTSSGHSINQSMVQQLTMEGNIRKRVRKASPRGDIHSTMWMLALTRLMYWEVDTNTFAWS